MCDANGAPQKKSLQFGKPSILRRFKQLPQLFYKLDHGRDRLCGSEPKFRRTIARQVSCATVIFKGGEIQSPSRKPFSAERTRWNCCSHGAEPLRKGDPAGLDYV